MGGNLQAQRGPILPPNKACLADVKSKCLKALPYRTANIAEISMMALKLYNKQFMYLTCFRLALTSLEFQTFLMLLPPVASHLRSLSSTCSRLGFERPASLFTVWSAISNHILLAESLRHIVWLGFLSGISRGVHER